MWSIRDENWKQYLKVFNSIGVKPSELNKNTGQDYATRGFAFNTKEQQFIDNLDVIVALIKRLVDTEKKVVELETKLRDQSSWLASKELQTNILARLEKVEKGE